MCNFDGGDCCLDDKIGDGYCDPLNFNRMCRNDEDDCSCEYNLIGNGQCDLINNKYNCDFDGGDCCQKHWISDGFCDKINYNLKCDYDGGDCCSSIVTDWQLVGNGDCQLYLNNEKCAYDGGDCCITIYYGDSECDTDNDNPGCGHDGGDCCQGNIETIGNGICEDENNNARCSFDGGDCCLANLNTASCSECKCKTEDEVINPYKICPNYTSIGNGICNDENNNPICQYDGGDCCLPNVNITACAECHCNNIDGDFDPCPSYGQIGDGQCNDINDNLICSHDGEDCYRYST